jgi:hypothetical protein
MNLPTLTLLLSKDELTELTGARQAKKQIKWLDQHAWIYTTSYTGEPRVAAAYFLSRLVTPTVASNQAEPRWTAASRRRGQVR